MLNIELRHPLERWRPHPERSQSRKLTVSDLRRRFNIYTCTEGRLAMGTSRRTFLGVTVGAAALTMVRPLADAVVLSDQNATAPPAAPAILRVHAAPAEVVNSFDPDTSL